ncbi:DUF4292 domain-containing protein [Maribacter stanieri]|uniref:Deoxyuridine 5'-triphosphate nucleotidohydrolase n=1 Tax=Maribacter stanieri TaxID=440514 RepID=A0A1I6HW26_9FLAO|nr:DUF4292 domain-containing protein [Maribacter stanieri]SFR58627.1 protein of unknown function [Maribacter stanieri]
MMKFLRTIKSKQIFTAVMIIFMASCKSTKVVSGGTVDEKLSSKSVIKAHYQNEAGFKTLSGRVKISYSDGEFTQNVSVSIRMEKDKAIWMSAPLGIVKAYITPDRVSFYNKLQNEYFDGDFSYLSELLGTDVDFSILQNLLTGQAIVDLREEKYDIDISDDSYRLTPKQQGTLYKTLFKVEPKNFKMALQQLSQPTEKRLLEITYQNYQILDKEILPNEIMVRAISKDQVNNIDLEFKNLELNGAVNFPYSIPKGFNEIEL